MNAKGKDTAVIRRLPVILFLLLSLPTLSAQVCEDFSDGNLHEGIAWSGDTNRFRINSSRQLQLYDDSAGTAQIAFSYPMPDNDTVEWTFWLRLGFTPTTNNYAVIALYADSLDLLSAPHSLLLKVTDPATSQKDISLYQDGTLLFTYQHQPRKSNNRLRFRIRLANRQQLMMAIDTSGNADSINFIDCGSAAVVNGDQPPAAFFGLYCQYTSSRAHLIYMDDIGINCSDPLPQKKDTINPGEVLINEVLFNPHPGGADYIEIYNNSDKEIDLSELFLAKTDAGSVTTLYGIASEGILHPHSLMAITTDIVDITNHYTVAYPNRLIQTSAMPTYPDKQGTVVIANIDSVVIDRFDYNASMHSSLLADIEGIALERRSLQRPTQDAANWYSASSTAGYGTPTAPNSQSRELLFVDNDIAIAPTLFSPDGDGYNDLIDITYKLDNCNLTADITIYNRQGNAVRHLAKSMLLGCLGDIVWDGTDDSGHQCPRGAYLVIIEAHNENGARQSWRRTINLVRQ